MSGQPEETVTVSPAPAATPVFLVGDVVREDVEVREGEFEHHCGTVVPIAGTPAGPTPYDPERVWVEFRGIPGQHSVPIADLAVLDVERAVRGTLDLLAKVGIHVTRHEVGISPEVADLICCDDGPEEHAGHARSLVLWFEGDDDLMALQELSYFGPFEFGRDWPTGEPTGVRGLIEDGPWILAVHLADLPDLGDLADRELAGEFGGSEGSIRRRRQGRSAVQVALLTVALQAARVVLFHRPLGWLGALALATAAVPLTLAAVRRVRHDRTPPRTTLDAVRRRSYDAARGSGPR